MAVLKATPRTWELFAGGEYLFCRAAGAGGSREKEADEKSEFPVVVVETGVGSPSVCGLVIKPGLLELANSLGVAASFTVTLLDEVVGVSSKTRVNKNMGRAAPERDGTTQRNEDEDRNPLPHWDADGAVRRGGVGRVSRWGRLSEQAATYAWRSMRPGLQQERQVGKDQGRRIGGNAAGARRAAR